MLRLYKVDRQYRLNCLAQFGLISLWKRPLGDAHGEPGRIDTAKQCYESRMRSFDDLNQRSQLLPALCSLFPVVRRRNDPHQLLRSHPTCGVAVQGVVNGRIGGHRSRVRVP